MPSGSEAVVIASGTITFILAEEVFPVPASRDETVTLLLTIPDFVGTTFTANVQELFGGKTAPDRLTLLDPAVAVIVPPPQEPLTPFGVATIRPAGKASLKATPLSAAAFELAMLKFKMVVSF